MSQLELSKYTVGSLAADLLAAEELANHIRAKVYINKSVDKYAGSPLDVLPQTREGLDEAVQQIARIERFLDEAKIQLAALKCVAKTGGQG